MIACLSAPFIGCSLLSFTLPPLQAVGDFMLSRLVLFPCVCSVNRLHQSAHALTA